MMGVVVLMIVGGSGMTGYIYLYSSNWARLVLQFYSPRVKFPLELKYLLAKENSLELRYLEARSSPLKYLRHHQNAVMQLHVFLAQPISFKDVGHFLRHYTGLRRLGGFFLINRGVGIFCELLLLE